MRGFRDASFLLCLPRWGPSPALLLLRDVEAVAKTVKRQYLALEKKKKKGAKREQGGKREREAWGGKDLAAATSLSCLGSAEFR